MNREFIYSLDGNEKTIYLNKLNHKLTFIGRHKPKSSSWLYDVEQGIYYIVGEYLYENNDK